MTALLQLPAPLFWAACLCSLGALGLLAAYLAPRLRARRDAARARYQLGPAQRHLPLPDQVVTLAGALACPQGSCARFEDGTPAAAATMWGASLRADGPEKRPLALSVRAPALTLQIDEVPVTLTGPLDVAVGAAEFRPGRNFNALDETIQRRTAAALDAPPAFHLDRVFCFRSVGPGTPVMVRGYLQLLAEQGDHEASYRQPAERWVLSPVSTAPGVGEGAPDVLELAAERAPAVQGPQWKRLLRGACLGLAAGALLAGGVTLRPSSSGPAKGPVAASSAGPAPVVWQAAAAFGERLKARPPATRRLVQVFQQVVDACALDAAGKVRFSPCSYPDVEQALGRQERVAGEQEALLTYCALTSHDTYRIRALAGSRIDLLLTRCVTDNACIARAASRAVQGCLTRRLRAEGRPDLARPLARALAFVGTELRRHREVMAALASHPSVSVRAAGYNALWTRGRLRVLPTLQRLVAARGEPYWVKAAALRGFHGHGLPLQSDEIERVCGLLEGLMQGDDLHLAATAAHQVVVTCRHPGRVLSAASDLIDRDHFNGDYVGVLWQLSSSTTLTPAQRRRAAALLRRVVRSPRSTDKTRAKARRALASRVIVLR
jgi:hypothetical protein